MTHLYVEPGGEPFVNYAIERLNALRTVRQTIRLPVMRKAFMPSDDVLVQIISSDYGDRIRILADPLIGWYGSTLLPERGYFREETARPVKVKRISDATNSAFAPSMNRKARLEIIVPPGTPEWRYYYGEDQLWSAPVAAVSNPVISRDGKSVLAGFSSDVPFVIHDLTYDTRAKVLIDASGPLFDMPGWSINSGLATFNGTYTQTTYTEATGLSLVRGAAVQSVVDTHNMSGLLVHSTIQRPISLTVIDGGTCGDPVTSFWREREILEESEYRVFFYDEATLELTLMETYVTEYRTWVYETSPDDTTWTVVMYSQARVGSARLSGSTCGFAYDGARISLVMTEETVSSTGEVDVGCGSTTYGTVVNTVENTLKVYDDGVLVFTHNFGVLASPVLVAAVHFDGQLRMVFIVGGDYYYLEDGVLEHLPDTQVTLSKDGKYNFRFDNVGTIDVYEGTTFVVSTSATSAAQPSWANPSQFVTAETVPEDHYVRHAVTAAGLVATEDIAIPEAAQYANLFELVQQYR